MASPVFSKLRLLLYGALSLSLSCATYTRSQKNAGLEQAICGVKEPIIFWQWSNAAGRPDPTRTSGIRNIQNFSITTRDHRILRGYMLKAHPMGERSARPKGYLLVVQGNATLADQLISHFHDFPRAGYDVYILDYRGYGRSQGKRRLKAILSDYDEITDHLNSLPYPKRLFYGISFGGVVLLNALQGKSGRNWIVVDSAPSRLSGYGCPETVDPVSNLPEDSSNLLLIIGEKDDVVTPAMSNELAAMALERGALVLQDPDLGHPFMDSDISRHNRRMRAVRAFLLNE